jgi:PadR family transcriptional regulator PadR
MAERLDPDMLRGSIDLLVLAVLLDGKKYGYLIQQQLRQASGHMVQLQAGTLYPLLHRLEAAGLICGQSEESTGRRRKWYELTGKGKRRLEKQANQWNRLADCLHVLLRPVLEGAG